MDQPEKKIQEKKVYHNLSLAEVKLLEKLVPDIKLLAENKKIYRRPRGRPRKNPTYEAYPITIPFSIPKRTRLKLTQRELMDITRIPKHKDLLEEYKNLLLTKFRNNTKPANKRYMANIKDITEFFQRLPRKVEQELLLNPIIPAELLDRPIPAKKIKGYILRKLRHFRYTYIISEEKKVEFSMKAEATKFDESIVLTQLYLNIYLKHLFKR